MEKWKQEMLSELVGKTGLPEKKCLTFLDRAEWTEKVYELPLVKANLKPTPKETEKQESLWDDDDDEPIVQPIPTPKPKTAIRQEKPQEVRKQTVKASKPTKRITVPKKKETPSESPKQAKPEGKDPQDGVTYVKNADMKGIMDWVKSHCKPWRPPEYNALDRFNEKKGTTYRSWEEVSEKEILSERELEEYFPYISWYHYLKRHDPRELSVRMQKKLGDRLDISIMGLDIIEREY